MGFKNDGSTHHEGIQNEKDIVDYANTHPENAITQHIKKEKGLAIVCYKHEGGTGQKKDASIIFENNEVMGISIKHHKLGTFDWENTTKGVPENVKEKVKEFRNQNINKPITKDLRSELENIFSSYLDIFTSNQITELLKKVWEMENETSKIVINVKKSKKLIMVDKSNLDKYFNPEHKHNFILKSTSRAKTSRQIWIKTSDEKEINTNLRIRLVLNNGITALLGQSKSNKNASPCLKIQQDKVDAFINSCEDKVTVCY